MCIILCVGVVSAWIECCQLYDPLLGIFATPVALICINIVICVDIPRNTTREVVDNES